MAEELSEYQKTINRLKEEVDDLCDYGEPVNHVLFSNCRDYCPVTGKTYCQTGFANNKIIETTKQ